MEADSRCKNDKMHENANKNTKIIQNDRVDESFCRKEDMKMQCCFALAWPMGR